MKGAWMIIIGIVAVVVVGLLGFLGGMGMLGPVKVEEKTMGPYIHVFESFQGPYSETRHVFDRVYQILKEKGIETTLGLGVYYDDPRKVAKENLRSDCGVALQPQDQDKIVALQDVLQVKTIEAGRSLVVTFPIKSGLSYMLGPIKAYPALTAYTQKNGLTITMTYEIYDVPNQVILFVAKVK